MNPLTIDIQRLQREINELALITEAEPPVVTRVLFSEADLRGREFVKKLCREAGLTLRADAVGNIFARWDGANASLTPVATGSHIDAIPNAGKYDGVVGVLGAIEAIRAMKKSGHRPQRAIELIVFTAEEPTRFGIGCIGSRLMSGVLSPERAATFLDRDGKAWTNGARAPDTPAHWILSVCQRIVTRPLWNCTLNRDRFWNGKTRPSASWKKSPRRARCGCS